MNTQPTSATPATPKTDAVAAKIGALAAEWTRGNICATDFAICAQMEVNKLGALETELARLRGAAAQLAEIRGIRL